MTAADKPLQLLVVMSIGPKWQNIDLLRTAVLNCVAVIVGEGDASETVGIIVSELLENAIKYGAWSEKEQVSVLRLNIAGDHERMNIEVQSPTAPGSADYEELMKTLKWIASFPSPREAYMERIRQVADGVADGTSKMGLVRIAHEGPCTLEARLDPDNTLVTTARTYLAPRSRV
jgi:anti-sigma regulatory factor (Ser/Thr protein kinase)